MVHPGRVFGLLAAGWTIFFGSLGLGVAAPEHGRRDAGYTEFYRNVQQPSALQDCTAESWWKEPCNPN